MRWRWALLYALAAAGVGSLWLVLLIRIGTVSPDSTYASAIVFVAAALLVSLAARKALTAGPGGLFGVGAAFPWAGLIVFAAAFGAATSETPEAIWDNFVSVGFWGFIALSSDWPVVVAAGFASALLLWPLAMRTVPPQTREPESELGSEEAAIRQIDAPAGSR
jgi:hypothetical protein